jgi:Winged helix DNA-binding domain
MAIELSEDQLRRARVASQHLHRPRRRSATEMVRYLLGVQSQIYEAGVQALQARTEGLTPEAVERARLRSRSIVWTWAMRGTLHFIAAEDHAWLVPLRRDRVEQRSHLRFRQMGMQLDEAKKALRMIPRMLEREGPLTRPEIADRLESKGVGLKHPQISYHLLFLAAGAGTIVRGPDRSQRPTYVLTRDWIRRSKKLPREKALAELAVRYLRAHQPAEPVDLSFWAGISMPDVRRGWKAIEHRLVEVKALGRTMWALKGKLEEAPKGVKRELPSFDEYLLGWKDRSFIADRATWRKINPGAGWYHPTRLVDGQLPAAKSSIRPESTR